MATSIRIPVPPRTPTPPPDNDQVEMAGLGLDGIGDLLSPTKALYDPSSLSPMDENFAVSRFSSSPSLALSSQPLSPTSPNSLYSSISTESNGGKSELSMQNGKGPFNFQPMSLAKSPITKSSVGQRRGHKYKHSSVSHQIFLEPTPRAPIALPSSLPIPTFAECRRSMSTEQKQRFYWSICHMAVAAYTLWSASGSLALTALSHLILFDSFGAMLCVIVDVLSNFEVWKRSSIRHPFGLERAEVLAGFAMSVLLLFMGMDLISHNLQHVLEELGQHAAHHTHEHARVSPGGIDAASLLAIVSTVISALGLQNHARIGKVMRFAYIETLPSILSNPSHFLTITCSSLLLLLPLLSVQMYAWLDRALSGTIALSMCVLGTRLVNTLGLMLLMSYTGAGVHDVIRDIESDPSVAAIEEAKFWQVHYGLCMANVKLRVRGTDDNMVRLRDRIASLIRNRLGGGYGGGGQRWEVSTQLTVEKY
ncbi:Endoplasmic reticulum zinc transporter [Xylographa carneopallida]|nr:Endoplasmic reticulum zinc transporter [Xylographa carneopallida]